MKTLKNLLVLGFLFSFLPGTGLLNATVAHETFTRPVPEETIHVLYPLSLIREVSGYAEVLFEVDKQGNPHDFVVLKASHTMFGQTVIDRVRKIHFQPARQNGKPVVSQIVHKNHFVIEAAGDLVQMGDQPKPYRVDENSVPLLVHDPRKLDDPIQVLTQVPPKYPEDWPTETQAGGVLIEFYIDSSGSVKAPKVVSSTDEALNPATLESIRQWIFKPPIRNGRPVTAFARQQFEY
ncbi:MAG: energy transducer TonB [Verrucomicrobia bacterium]|nr:energy transducer TonB [Verrucomicrobiota bacterium]